MAGPSRCHLLVIFLLQVTLNAFATLTLEGPANVKDCERQFTEKCGIEVGNGIFNNGFLSDDCCRDLVKLGKPCHDTFLNTSLAARHPSANKAQTLAKGEKIWTECVAIDNSDKHETKPVKECLEKFPPTCGEQIEKSIYQGTVVTDACCRDLVSWGKSCHDIIAERNHDVRHPSVNKAQALASSRKVWNLCAAISRSPASFPLN
ncbi:putative Prolamin-like domain-containing protein [Rosa chinensis]|uniref:Putative Prolamin-like domain-containing protein n=1 Tax=Rosa chinensis TaxID=74649 RepID=A0A2P6QFD5_ROSCH|nr:putative Prolamin-like domain-containing protein [Rosa chinensis]